MVFSGRSREVAAESDPDPRTFSPAAPPSTSRGAAQSAESATSIATAATTSPSPTRARSASTPAAPPSRRAQPAGHHHRQFRHDVQVSGAGDVDADGTTDLLVTSDGSRLRSFRRQRTGGTRHRGRACLGAGAIALPGGHFRPIGDFDGDGAADLGAAVMLESNRLTERDQPGAPGAGRATSGARFIDSESDIAREPRRRWRPAWNTAADMIIEPGRASYAAPGTVQPQVLLFGPLGSFEQDGTDLHASGLRRAGGRCPAHLRGRQARPGPGRRG